MPRLVHVLFTALLGLLAVLAGLVVAAAVALTGVALVLTRRFRVRRPLDSGRGSVPAPAGHGDVIDVTATEIASEPLAPPR